MRTLQAWCIQCTFELAKEVDLKGEELKEAAEAFQQEAGKRHAKESNPSHVVRVQYSADLRQG